RLGLAIWLQRSYPVTPLQGGTAAPAAHSRRSARASPLQPLQSVWPLWPLWHGHTLSGGRLKIWIVGFVLPPLQCSTRYADAPGGFGHLAPTSRHYREGLRSLVL